MKHLFSSVATTLATIACAFSLGSCSRANYAVLPKSAPYLGSVTNQRPAAAPAISQQPVQQPEQAVVAEATVAQKATTAQEAVAAAPTQPARAHVAPTVVLAASPAATGQAKPGLAQRLLVQKVMKKADKLTAKVQSKYRQGNTAETSRLNSNLKLGIVLLVVGALITLLPGGIFDLIGAIIAILGLLFILLAILDMI